MWHCLGMPHPRSMLRLYLRHKGVGTVPGSDYLVIIIMCEPEVYPQYAIISWRCP